MPITEKVDFLRIEEILAEAKKRPRGQSRIFPDMPARKNQERYLHTFGTNILRCRLPHWEVLW